jgi:putative glycosyltransferase
MKLSVVTSLYCSAPYLPEFIRRTTAAAAHFAGDDFELVMVNDGSPDEALAVALKFRAADPRIKIVDLSRNFGHHQALMTGIAHTVGDYVFLIDCDLEEAPELLGEFARRLTADPDADVAYGVQKTRRGSWFERFSGQLFYRLMRILSDLDYPADTLTARLMTRRYVEALKLFDDREFDLWINFSLAGFTQLPVPAEKNAKGVSAYTLRKKIRHAVESITASSAGPLYLIFAAGWIVFSFAVLHLAFVAVNRIFWQVPVGWSHLVASIWGLGGMLMISVGTVGIYLAKIFIETKKRPAAIIRKIYGDDRN